MHVHQRKRCWEPVHPFQCCCSRSCKCADGSLTGTFVRSMADEALKWFATGTATGTATRSLQTERPVLVRPQRVCKALLLGRRWRELLLEKGYNGGEPITEAWFTEHLSGGHNPEAVAFLFPGISDSDNAAVADDKEARFRKLAGAPPTPPTTTPLD